MTDDETDVPSAQLEEAAQRLRRLYSAQLSCAAPQLDVLYHCALGLALTGSAADCSLSADILLQLVASGYMVQDCQLQLARAYARLGLVLDARRCLSACLLLDPDWEDARDFQLEFDRQVKRDGKLALCGALVLAAAAAIVYAACSRGRGGAAVAAQQAG